MMQRQKLTVPPFKQDVACKHYLLIVPHTNVGKKMIWLRLHAFEISPGVSKHAENIISENDALPSIVSQT